MKKKQIFLLTAGVLLLFLTPLTVFAIMLRSAERVNQFRPAKQEIAIVENNGKPVETQENEIKWSSTTNASGNRVAEKEVQVGEMSNPNGDYMRVCIVPTWFDDSGCAVAGVGDVTDVICKSKIVGNTLLFTDARDITKITINLDPGWTAAWKPKSMDGTEWKLESDGTTWKPESDDTESEPAVTPGELYFESLRPIQSGEKKKLITSVEISDELLQNAEAQNLFLRVDVLADSIQTSGNAKSVRWN